MDEIFESIISVWKTRIKAGLDARKTFDRIGDTLWDLYTNPEGEWIRDQISERFGIEGNTKFPVKYDKVTELVDLYGAMLHNRNPLRVLTARMPYAFDVGTYYLNQQEIQRRQHIQELMSQYLNYTVNEWNFKGQCRQALAEGLIRGRGCMWLTMFTKTNGTKIVTHEFDTVKRFVIDPLGDSLEDADWIARLRGEKTFKSRRKFQIPGQIPMNSGAISVEEFSSIPAASLPGIQTGGDVAGGSREMTYYWEVFSRMGLGGRFDGASRELREFEKDLRKNKVIGDYVRLAIPIGNFKSPLNMVRQSAGEELSASLKWPVDLHEDGRWPVSVLDLHPIAADGKPGKGYLWPRSHLQGVLPELFLMSFILSRIAHKTWFSTREIIAVAESLNTDTKAALAGGEDTVIVEIANDQIERMDMLITTLKQSPIPLDLFKVFDLIAAEVDRKTGLTELITGQKNVSMRTKDEAKLKGDMASLRPDDLADIAESWQTEMARNEYHTVRVAIRGQDIGNLIGEQAVPLWDKYVAVESVRDSASEFECRIQAGSARRPNKEKQREDADHLSQHILPIMVQWAQQTGNVGPVNAILSTVYEAYDIEKPTELFLEQPPPPEPPPEQTPAGAPQQGQQQQQPAPQPAPQQQPPQQPAMQQGQPQLPPEMLAMLQQQMMAQQQVPQ